MSAGLDPLVRAALLGTAQTQGEALTATPIDALTAPLAGAGRERLLLLRAGALDVYRVAGRRTDAGALNPSPCPPDPLRPCSPAMTEVLRAMLQGEQQDLLPLALAEMRGNGLVLPHELLPLALACPEDRRPFLRPLLGARGRWLAAQNPAWAWAVREGSSADDPPPADAARIWDEGDLAERRQLLRQLRRHDPARGRALLAAAWKQEKAETRRAFLAIMAIGLSADDEAFLEEALADRSAAIRGKAAELLSRLPASRLCARMLARAEQVVVADGPRFALRPPAAFDPTWEKDAVLEVTPQGGIPRALWWIDQVLAATPLAHWEAKVRAGPRGVVPAITAAIANHDVLALVLDGLTAAALRQDAHAWMGPLWDAWRRLGRPGVLTPKPLAALLGVMAPADAEARICALLRDGTLVPELMEALPRPWTDAIAAAFLKGLHDWIARLERRRAESNDPWLATLRLAATTLPSGQLTLAQALPPPPDGDNWYRDKWRTGFRDLQEAIRLRQRLAQEMQA